MHSVEIVQFGELWKYVVLSYSSSRAYKPYKFE